MECTGCQKGINMCYSRPCMGTPEEFNKILDAGYAGNIHRDYWGEQGQDDIYFLSGSIYDVDTDALLEIIHEQGSEPMLRTELPYQKNHSGGKSAPWWPVGKCSLLTEDNLCSLHAAGLKPEQGQEACCKVETVKDNKYYVDLWNTAYGKSVIAKWESLTGY